MYRSHKGPVQYLFNTSLFYAPLILASFLFSSGSLATEWVLQHFTTDLQPVEEGFKTRQIHASSRQQIIFGIVSKNPGFVSEAKAKLLDQCDGPIIGVSSTLVRETDFFHYWNRLDLLGFCVEPE